MSNKRSESKTPSPERKFKKPNEGRLSAREIERIDTNEEYVKKQYEFVQEGQLKKQRCRWCNAYFKNAPATLTTHLKGKCPQYAKRREKGKGKEKGKEKENRASGSGRGSGRREPGKDKRKKPASSTDDEVHHEQPGKTDTVTWAEPIEPTMDPNHHPELMTMQRIRQLQEQKLLAGKRSCGSCFSPMEMSSGDVGQDRWLWECSPCNNKVSLREGSAISASGISLEQFQILVDMYTKGEKMGPVAEHLNIPELDVKAVFDKLTLLVVDGKTQIKAETPQPITIKPFLKTRQAGEKPFELGQILMPELKKEPLEIRQLLETRQLLLEDPRGTQCEVHLLPYGFPQCTKVKEMGKNLCRIHNVKVNIQQTKENFLPKKQEPRTTPKHPVVHVPVFPPPPVVHVPVFTPPPVVHVPVFPPPPVLDDDDELPAPFDEEEEDTTLQASQEANEFSFMTPTRGSQDSDPLRAPAATVPAPAPMISTHTSPARVHPPATTAPPAPASLVHTAQTLVHTAPTLVPKFVSVSSQTDTNTVLVTEAEKERAPITSVLFEHFKLGEFATHLKGTTHLTATPEMVDKVIETYEEVPLSEYINDIWQQALQLHSKSVNKIFNFLLVIDNFQMRLETVSMKRRRSLGDELDKILAKLDDFTVLVMHRYSLLSCLQTPPVREMKITSSRLCNILFIKITEDQKTATQKEAQRERQGQVFDIVKSGYALHQTRDLFLLRAVARDQGHILPILACEMILNAKFDEGDYTFKLSLVDAYLKHLNGFRDEPLYPSSARMQHYGVDSILWKLVTAVYVECNRGNKSSDVILKHCAQFREESDVGLDNMSMHTPSFLRCRACSALVPKDSPQHHRCRSGPCANTVVSSEVSSSSPDIASVETCAVATQANMEDNFAEPQIDDSILDHSFDIRNPNQVLPALVLLQSLERDNDGSIKQTNLKLERLRLDVFRNKQIREDQDVRSERIKTKRNQILEKSLVIESNVGD